MRNEMKNKFKKTYFTEVHNLECNTNQTVYDFQQKTLVKILERKSQDESIL